VTCLELRYNQQLSYGVCVCERGSEASVQFCIFIISRQTIFVTETVSYILIPVIASMTDEIQIFCLMP